MRYLSKRIILLAGCSAAVVALVVQFTGRDESVASGVTLAVEPASGHESSAVAVNVVSTDASGLPPGPLLNGGGPEPRGQPAPPVEAPATRAPIPLLLTFPGGEEVAVKLEFPPSPVLENLSDRLLDDYAWMHEAALGGDSTAARTLALSLSRCRNAFTDRTSLDGAVGRLREERVLTYPDHSERAVEYLAPTSNVEQHVASAVRQFEFCEGMTPDQLSEEGRYAKLAADAGDYAGTSHWARMLYEAEDANGHLEVQTELWNAGWIAAADTLSLHYQNKIHGGALEQPDWVRAYAYMQIYDSFNQALPDGVIPVPYSLRVSSTRDVLAGIGAFLTPQQQLEAEALAIDLLRAHPNCCKW